MLAIGDMNSAATAELPSFMLSQRVRMPRKMTNSTVQQEIMIQLASPYLCSVPADVTLHPKECLYRYCGCIVMSRQGGSGLVVSVMIPHKRLGTCNCSRTCDEE